MFGHQGNVVIEVRICLIIMLICLVIEIQKRSVIDVFLPRQLDNNVVWLSSLLGYSSPSITERSVIVMPKSQF